MIKINNNIRFCSSASSQKLNEDARSGEQNSNPAFDKFIKDCDTIEKSNNKPASFVKKLFAYPTLSLIPVLPLCISGIHMFSKRSALKKQSKTSADKMTKYTQYDKNLPKKLAIFWLSMFPIGFAMNAINKSNRDKHNKNAHNIVNDFNKKNKSNVELKVQPLGIFVAAAMDPVSGKINMDDRYVEDSLYASTHQKPYLKHELVHAKQYMLMACSDGGIEKLNYIVVKKLAKAIDENGRKEVAAIYNEIQSGTSDKYKNATLDRWGYKINSIDYITALYKVMFEPEIKPKDIPIIINKDYYEQVRAQKGKLSAAEEKKAQEYLKAYEEYPTTVGFTQMINPRSQYRQNIMEKEAYQMNPWYTY